MTAEPDSTDQNDQAIITFPSPHLLLDVSLTKLESDDVKVIDFAQQQFQIRLANSQGVREKASLNSLAQREPVLASMPQLRDRR